MEDTNNAGIPAPATADETADTGTGSGQEKGSGTNETAQEGKGASLLGGADKPAAPAPTGAPEKYDFSSIIPEGAEVDEKAASEFGAIAKELNLSQEQANKLATYGFSWLDSNMKAGAAAREQKVAGWADDTRKQLGGQFDETVAKAVSAADAIEKLVPGFKNAMGVTGAGNRVEIIKGLSQLSQFIQQDGGHGGGANNSGGRFTYDKTDFSKY